MAFVFEMHDVPISKDVYDENKALKGMMMFQKLRQPHTGVPEHGIYPQKLTTL